MALVPGPGIAAVAVVTHQELEAICPECGRPRVTGVAPDATGPAAVARAGAVAPAPSRRGAVSVAALVLAVVGVLLVFMPGDDTGPDVSPPEDVADPVPGPTPPPVSSLPVPQPAPVPPDLTLSAGQRVAYASTEGLVIVETTTGAVDVTEVVLTSPRVDYADPFVLVADDRRTLAVHPAATAEPFVLASNYRLVATAEPEQYVFVPAAVGLADADRVFVGQASDGSFGPMIAIPPGSRRLAVSGIGLLVTPPGEVTHEVRFGGLTPFAGGEVLAAAGDHRLEVACDDDLVCAAAVVDAATGTEVEVPAEVVARLGRPALSPDGRRLAGRGDEQVTVVDVATGAVADLEVEGPVVAFGWTPDGDVLVVLVGPREDASIVVMRLDDQPGAEPAPSTEVLRLDAIGAPAPLGNGIVGF